MRTFTLSRSGWRRAFGFHKRNSTPDDRRRQHQAHGRPRSTEIGRHDSDSTIERIEPSLFEWTPLDDGRIPGQLQEIAGCVNDPTRCVNFLRLRNPQGSFGTSGNPNVESIPLEAKRPEHSNLLCRIHCQSSQHRYQVLIHSVIADCPGNRRQRKPPPARASYHELSALDLTGELRQRRITVHPGCLKARRRVPSPGDGLYPRQSIIPAETRGYQRVRMAHGMVQDRSPTPRHRRITGWQGTRCDLGNQLSDAVVEFPGGLKCPLRVQSRRHNKEADEKRLHRFAFHKQPQQAVHQIDISRSEGCRPAAVSPTNPFPHRAGHTATSSERWTWPKGPGFRLLATCRSRLGSRVSGSERTRIKDVIAVRDEPSVSAAPATRRSDEHQPRTHRCPVAAMAEPQV